MQRFRQEEIFARIAVCLRGGEASMCRLSSLLKNSALSRQVWKPCRQFAEAEGAVDCKLDEVAVEGDGVLLVTME